MSLNYTNPLNHMIVPRNMKSTLNGFWQSNVAASTCGTDIVWMFKTCHCHRAELYPIPPEKESLSESSPQHWVNTSYSSSNEPITCNFTCMYSSCVHIMCNILKQTRKLRSICVYKKITTVGRHMCRIYQNMIIIHPHLMVYMYMYNHLYCICVYIRVHSYML